MPLVRSFDVLADGFRIVTTARGTHTFTSAQLSAAQKIDTIANVEAFINNALTTALPGEFVAVHLTSIVPLLGNAIVSNTPLVGSWWL